MCVVRLLILDGYECDLQERMTPAIKCRT